jgi:hypothetical protein
MTTVSTKQNWIVEFYPYEKADPLDDQEITLPPGIPGPIRPSINNILPIQVVGSKNSNVAKIKKQLQEQGFAGDDKTQYIQNGITSLNFERSKGTPEHPCTMTMVGPLPKAVVEGTWVLISSIVTATNNSEKHLIKFFGQIHTINVDYVTLENGLVAQQNSIGIRSWASMLTTPVKFDVGSFADAVKKDISGAAGMIKAITGESPAKTLNNIVSKTFNCFEFAQVILSLVGCINQKDMVDTVKALKAGNFSQLGVSMPSIPDALLKRLGYSVDNPLNPFQTNSGRGLLDVISGVQTDEHRSIESWDGVFGTGEIEEFKQKFAKESDVRPLAPGSGLLASLGTTSIWSLLSQYVDSLFHETFTDLLYEESNGALTVRPVLFVRDKPFLPSVIVNNPAKFELDAKEGALLQKNWTRYDHIPRIFIPSEYIQKISFQRTMLNSPNYFTFAPQSMAGRHELEQSVASFSRFRLDKHVRRFGGQQLDAASQYNPVSLSTAHDKSGIGLEEWVKTANAVIKAWQAFNYKQPSATLIIKDPSIALTIGFNLHFTFGKNDFVGHIENISVSFRVLPNGLEETVMTVALSRVMFLDLGSGVLFYIPPESLGDLINLPQQSDKSSPISNLLGNIPSLPKNLLGNSGSFLS